MVVLLEEWVGMCEYLSIVVWFGNRNKKFAEKGLLKVWVKAGFWRVE